MKRAIFVIFFLNLLYFTFCDETSDHKSLGNRWYSSQTFFVTHTLETGMSGSKDFLTEYFLFSYSFKSKNRHTFTIRNYHIGYAPGLFTANLHFFNFAFMVGFEYLYKIFSSTEGLFLFTDIGGSNGGVAINSGVGVGSRTKTGFEINFTFLQNILFLSRIEFYFLVFNFLVLRGKMGFDLKYRNTDIEIFTFLIGGYIGFSVRQYFKIEIGGGVTVNDYAYYSGFGSVIIGINIF